MTDEPNFRPSIPAVEAEPEAPAPEPEPDAIDDLSEARANGWGDHEDGGEDMTGVADYPILGAPTISLATFSAVLQNAGSPAAPEAAGMYQAATHYGVDPAVLLAVFQHESSFGKSGVARNTRNVGNLEWHPVSAGVGAVQAGRWASYPSWTASASDTARLLASTMYGRSSQYATVRTFPFRWAPSSDGNAPTSYGAALAASIHRWSGQAGSIITALPRIEAAALPAKHPAARPAAKLPTMALASGDLATLGALALAGFAVIALILVMSGPRHAEGPSA